jgi:hypothetical protein
MNTGNFIKHKKIYCVFPTCILFVGNVLFNFGYSIYRLFDILTVLVRGSNNAAHTNASKINIQLDYLHTRLTVNGVLKGFLKKGDSQLAVIRRL